MKESEDLQERVAHWLSNQGYPLEMTVASIFRKHEFDVSQGIYYSDPETAETREIDVVADRSDFVGLLGVFMVIECKSSKDKPWVIFSSGQQCAGWVNFGMMSDLAWKTIIPRVTGGMDMDPIREFPWLNKKPNGHGMAVAFGKGEDPAYKAILSCLKASIDCVHEQSDRKYPRLSRRFPCDSARRQAIRGLS